MSFDDVRRSQVFNAIEDEKAKRDKMYDSAVKGAYGDLCFDFLLSKCQESFRVGRTFEFCLPKSRKLPEWARIGLSVMSERKYCVTYFEGKKLKRWSVAPPPNNSVDTSP